MILRILLLVAATGAFVIGNAVLGIMGKWTQDLPSTTDLKAYEPPLMTRIYAGDGTLVKEYAYQHRVFVPEEEIPDHLIHAFISAEDKTFFEHEGIDLKGLLRGTVFNAVRGRRMAGGSTITQQVVKNMLVGDERSAERKIREAFVAKRLEGVFEKREILELYLNEIYLGGRYYGVGSAALNYFGKSLKNLDLSEAALLAAMPKAPGKVNPYQKPDAARERRNWVLSRMAANGYISQEDLAAAQDQPLTTVERLNSDEIRAAGYFVEEVRREILRRSEAGEIEGIDSEEPRIKAKFEAGTLKMREIYANKESFVDFMRELSSRSLVRADELEEIMSARVSCEEEEVPQRECGQFLFRTLLGMEKPQDVAPLDMVMNWRERLRNYELLYEDGLSVRSTLDSRYQLAAQRSLQMGLETYDRRNGYRGPVTRIELGEGWPERLNKINVSKTPDWTAGVVLSVGRNAISVGLPDGEKVPLAEESVEFLAGADPKVKAGDVVYVSHEPPPNVLTRTILQDVKVKESDPWHVRQLPDVQGALVALDPHTGRVLAMAGGYSFRHNQFNRAVQAMRQPGSSIKPIVYAAALDSGYTPASTILDAPFVVESEVGQPPWRPGNYARERFYGMSTLRLGIEKSRNLMTARLATDVGMDKVAEYGRKFGIYPEPPEDATAAQKRAILGPQTYYSRSLGAGETTPLKMAIAYAMMVNGGKQIEPVILDRIQNRHGDTILKRDQRDCEGCNAAWSDQPPPMLADPREQAIDPITAFQSVWIMKGVVERGTASRVRIPSPKNPADIRRDIAGKTGTTNDYVDSWFVGFSPDLVAAIWVGKDMAVSLGEGESGGRVAAPIFRDFMMVALKNQEEIGFRAPSGVRFVEIDAKTGELPGPDTDVVIQEAFRPGTEPGSRSGSDTAAMADFFERIKRGEDALPGEGETIIDPFAPQPSVTDEPDGAEIIAQQQETQAPGQAPGSQSGDPNPAEPPVLGDDQFGATPPVPAYTPPPDQSLDYDQQF